MSSQSYPVLTGESGNEVTVKVRRVLAVLSGTSGRNRRSTRLRVINA